MDGIGRYAGIDWAKEHHAVCVVDDGGEVAARFEVEHTATGLRELVRRLKDVDGVAIERPDGPVIDALLEASLRVVVIPSRHVKALRTRHGLTGNKDDRMDALVLADALRTDGHRLRPLRPDAEATVALRASVRARKDLVQTRVSLVQRLEAHLALVFPGAVDLFADLASDIAQAFLLRFPSAERAAWLSPRRLEHWLAAQGYCGRRSGAELHARLVSAPVGLRGDVSESMAAVTLAYVRAIAAVRDQIAALDARIVEQLLAHPDGHVFTSLPRSGRVRAAALLGLDRRLPGALPDGRVAGLPGRSHAIHAAVGPASDRDLPLPLRQEAARRGHRLRRGQSPGERLGSRALRSCPGARQDASPCRPHPGSRLGPRDLALLAGRRRLRPGTASGASARASRLRGLTAGLT